MRIVCSKCNTEYDIELPRTALEGKHRSLKFRCSSCGFIFTTHLEPSKVDSKPTEEVSDPGKKKPQAPTAAAAAAPKGILLKQEGKIYNVRDQATLQRWIIERRVLRDDEISSGGAVWEKVADRADLQSFFELVDKADKTGEEGAWVSWDQNDGAPPPPNESTGEILGALEADDDGTEGLATEEAETEEMGDGRLRDDFSAILPASSRPDDAGIPAFPMGGALGRQDPLAMSGTRPSGQTGRDQVFDAFPMDQMGDDAAPAQPVAPSPPPTPVRQPDSVPSTPIISQISTASSNPVLGSVSPVLAQAPTPVPVPMPMPVPVAPQQVGTTIPPIPRKSRELDWEDDRRGRSSSNNDINWTLIAVVAILVIGVGMLVLALRQQPTPQPMYVMTPQQVGLVPVQQGTQVLPTTTAPTTTAPTTAPTTTAPETTAPTTTTPTTTAPTTTTPTTTTPETTTTPAQTEPAPKSGGSSGKSLTKQGWAALDRGDYSKARSLCLDAAAQNPLSADAHYCVGMASENQGDISTAVDRYCQARSLTTDPTTSRELDGILKRLGRSCP